MLRYSEDLLIIDNNIWNQINIPPTASVNSIATLTSKFNILSSIRDYIRTLIHEALVDISSLNSEANFYTSLLVALIALMVSIAGILIP